MARTASASTRELDSRTAVESRKPAPGIPPQEAIAHLAYVYWLEREASEGSAEEDWLRAERDLRGLKSSRS